MIYDVVILYNGLKVTDTDGLDPQNPSLRRCLSYSNQCEAIQGLSRQESSQRPRPINVNHKTRARAKSSSHFEI